MKQVCLSVVAISAVVTAARSDGLPGGPLSWPDRPEATIPKSEIVLHEDTTLAYDALTFVDGTIITTGGHDFKLRIRNKLTIAGAITIRAFDPDLVPVAPPPIPQAGRGTNYDRGPASEGAARATDGANGGPGNTGVTGTTGLAGYDAGPITLRFDPLATASGTLQVSDKGGTGGPGGPGGTGGQGGDGQQGGRGRDGPFDCSNGPGTGGRAGDGGPGGQGGRGGDGGQGGLIVVQTTSKPVQDWLSKAQLEVSGGEPGRPGSGGDGGLPGSPGYGGRGSHHCQGREADRMGPMGKPGAREAIGAPGATSGKPGRVVKFLD